MKRYSSVFFGVICAATVAAPSSVHAMSWDWVPRVLRYENPYRGLDASRYPGFECKIRNFLGDCVAFSYIDNNRPGKHPGGGKPKNYYRRISSFGGGIDYSDCQIHDRRRESARRTRPQGCDYGQLRTYETAGGTR